MCIRDSSDSGDTVCVMDQVKDSKNTDEMWLERIALKEAVSRLTPREQKILSMRFYHSKTQICLLYTSRCV